MRIGADIAAGLLRSAAAAISLAERLPRTAAGRHVGLQLVRAITSAGSNYEEARAAESRADFIHKVGVAAKEMRETCYWLRLIECVRWVDADITAVVDDAHDLAARLGASSRTARARAADP